MGRRSAFGLSFLVCRPDSGTFSYTRDVAPPVQPFVSGEIELSWTGTRRAIGSSAVIKVALKTTDERTAKVRWAEVHPQVERLIATAEARVREATRPSPKAVRVSGLSGANIQVLTAQAHHDILFEHDEVTLTPGKLTPLQEVLLRVQGSVPGSAARDLDAVRRLSHEIEARHARNAARDPSSLDVFNRPATWKSGPTLGVQEGERFSLPELEFAFVAESDVGQLLAKNGIELPVGHPDRRKLALSQARAQARAHEAVLKRFDGEPIETPNRPDPLKSASETLSSGQTLTQAYERWRSVMKPAEHTATDYRVQVDRFVGLHGDLAVAGIKRNHIRQFRDALETFPRNVPPSKADWPFTRLVAWGSERPDVPKLSRSTINDKAVGALSAILAVALADDHIESNACHRMKFKLKDGDVGERLPYELPDLVRVFNSPVYGTPPKRYHASGGEAGFWIPLLGLFTGARLEEIGQLRPDDVKQVDGILYLDLAEIDDTPGQETRRKTSSSRRQVPLHRELILCGFLEYVAQRKRAGDARLFPQLRRYRGKLTAGWSKWWGRYARKHMSPDCRKCFHSFRHAVADALRAAGVAETVIQRILGHSRTDTTSRYGAGYNLRALNAAVQRIRYPGLDLTHLYQAELSQAPQDSGVGSTPALPRAFDSGRSNRVEVNVLEEDGTLSLKE